MRRLFVDTSAYFALTDQRDENHEAAVRFIHQLIRERVELLTTNYILAETHTLLLNRIGYTTALDIIRIYTDKEFSLVDAISFATMERFHMTQAFAFDPHFAQYGFSLLPATKS